MTSKLTKKSDFALCVPADDSPLGDDHGAARPKAINKPKTSSVGVGLVKPVAAYGAKAAKQPRDYRVALPELGLVKTSLA